MNTTDQPAPGSARAHETPEDGESIGEGAETLAEQLIDEIAPDDPGTDPDDAAVAEMGEGGAGDRSRRSRYRDRGSDAMRVAQREAFT